MLCNISTKIKTHYKRHLLTKKHKNNESKYVDNDEKKNNSSYVCPPNNSEYLQSPPPNNSNALQITPNNSENTENTDNLKNKFNCDYCNKSFSRIDNLTRHVNKRCQKAKEHITYKELFLETKKQLKEEKEDYKKQMELLLSKVGNTTNHINNTQNIQLNSYGKEDLSHITDSLKTKLLKIPYGMIPKMIEAVHFNNSKPENKNIAFTNKKDNKIKVFSGNKWIYKDKDETLNDLIDGKYFILDSHYETDMNDCNMTVTNKSSYKQFRNFFDDKDKELHDQLKKECELVLLNNR
jgi:hypothetical protein